MTIYSQHVFEKIFLDKDPSDFIKYISAGVERELVTKVIDKLGDHKLYIVKLQEPEIIEDLPEYWNDTCAYRQKLECTKIVQCKDCRMVYPWCQRFRDELGGYGFCPYGNPYGDVKVANDEWESENKCHRHGIRLEDGTPIYECIGCDKQDCESREE